MKYRIYIDEVGNNDIGSSSNPNHRYLCLTGVVINLDYVKTVLTPDLEFLKNNYFNSHPDEPVIFHRKEMVNKKYPFKALQDPETEHNFNKDFLKMLEKWNYKTITVLIDKLEHQTKYENWRYDPYHYCMNILLERFHLRLKEIGSTGDIMFESRGGKEDMRLKASYQRIYEHGTEWIQSDDLKSTITSKELKIKPKSANISGLQLADLIAYPLYRYALKYYSIRDDGRETFNEQMLEVLKPKIFRNVNKMDGYGLKKLP